MERAHGEKTHDIIQCVLCDGTHMQTEQTNQVEWLTGFFTYSLEQVSDICRVACISRRHTYPPQLVVAIFGT